MVPAFKMRLIYFTQVAVLLYRRLLQHTVRKRKSRVLITLCACRAVTLNFYCSINTPWRTQTMFIWNEHLQYIFCFSKFIKAFAKSIRWKLLKCCQQNCMHINRPCLCNKFHLWVLACVLNIISFCAHLICMLAVKRLSESIHNSWQLTINAVSSEPSWARTL